MTSMASGQDWLNEEQPRLAAPDHLPHQANPRAPPRTSVNTRTVTRQCMTRLTAGFPEPWPRAVRRARRHTAPCSAPRESSRRPTDRCAWTGGSRTRGRRRRARRQVRAPNGQGEVIRQELLARSPFRRAAPGGDRRDLDRTWTWTWTWTRPPRCGVRWVLVGSGLAEEPGVLGSEPAALAAESFSVCPPGPSHGRRPRGACRRRRWPAVSGRAAPPRRLALGGLRRSRRGPRCG